MKFTLRFLELAPPSLEPSLLGLDETRPHLGIELNASSPQVMEQAALDAAAYLKANPEVQTAWDAAANGMVGTPAEKSQAGNAFAIMHYSKEGVGLGKQWPPATLPLVIEAGQLADAALTLEAHRWSARSTHCSFSTGRS